MLERKNYDDISQLDKDSGEEIRIVSGHKRKVARKFITSAEEIEKKPKQPKTAEKNPYQEAAERAAKSLAPSVPQESFNRTMTNKGGMMNYNVGGKAKAGTQPMYSEVMPKAGPC
jgi:hypothetical protein